MRPILKRYIFQSGLDIVVPLKCGTRWLEGLDVDTRIHRIGFHIEDLKENVHSGTTFIWRPVREHFLSALQTELATRTSDLTEIINEIEMGTCDHWYKGLYKELYLIWKKTPFQFYKLRAISELTPTAKEIEYISSTYDFDLNLQWCSIEEVLNSLSPKHTIRLNKLIGDEEKWLKLMIKPQYSGKNWEMYSDLEDEILSLKYKVKRLEAENARITNSKWVKEFVSKIRELRESNNKLESKVEFCEKLLGRKIIKLI